MAHLVTESPSFQQGFFETCYNQGLSAKEASNFYTIANREEVSDKAPRIALENFGELMYKAGFNVGDAADFDRNQGALGGAVAGAGLGATIAAKDPIMNSISNIFAKSKNKSLMATAFKKAPIMGEGPAMAAANSAMKTLKPLGKMMPHSGKIGAGLTAAGALGGLLWGQHNMDRDKLPALNSTAIDESNKLNDQEAFKMPTSLYKVRNAQGIQDGLKDLTEYNSKATDRLHGLQESQHAAENGNFVSRGLHKGFNSLFGVDDTVNKLKGRLSNTGESYRHLDYLSNYVN